MNSKTVLVTGGAGYIGSHACKALAKAGYTPVSYDNLSYGHKESVLWGPLEQGDILDPACLDQVFKQYRPVAVMHFAAFAYVGESVLDPLKYYRNNVGGSINLVNRMIENGIDKIIFSSTCAVYGVPDILPLTEAHPKHPINPYGNTKSMIEFLLSDLSAINKLKYIALRYFNAAGADPDGDIGENHDPETHLIPLVLQTAAGLRQQIDVYGNDYETRDGTCIRDYIHVTDLADAHVRALDYLIQGGESEVLNLGSEHGYSVMEIINNAKRITGQNISINMAPRRPGDPPSLIASSRRIKEVLGWSATRSDLDSILGTAWGWQIQHQD